MGELLVKAWEGIRNFFDVLKESTGSFFRHMRVAVKEPLVYISNRKILVVLKIYLLLP